MNSNSKKILFLAPAIALFTALAGCGTSGTDLCDDKCACEGCSNATFDGCVDEEDDRLKRAEERGCVNLYDESVACRLEELECSGSHAHYDGCGTEEERLHNCIK